MTSKIYEYGEIFSEDPDDNEQLLMTIPEDIVQQTGWQTGDDIIITIEDNKITLKKKNG